MPRYVALLRGINVGTSKRVAMADLRELLAGLGYSDIRTLLNSGNAVFEAKRANVTKLASAIESALASRIGVESKTIVLGGSEFRLVLEENPLLDVADNHSRLFVAFVQDPARLESLRLLAKHDWAAEAIGVGRQAAYLWCPGGSIESPVMKAVSRQLGDSMTTRNWATTGKIAALLAPQ